MKMGKRFRSILYFLAPILVLCIVWELFSRLELINPVLLSRPSVMLESLYDLLVSKSPGGYPVLLVHIGTSLYRLVVAFIIAAVAGIGLGILMGANRRIYRFLDPLITFVMPIPGIAWAPILMLWLGFGDPTIITVGALATFFPIVYNTSAGVRSIDQKLVWSARSMGAGRAGVFFQVSLPGAAVHIFTGLKLGFARGWRTIIAVEMIAASLWGLGFMIFDAREYLLPSVIYGGILILAIIYLIIENVLLNFVEKRSVMRWGMIRVEEI